MQLKPRDLPAYLKNPAAYKAVLIYGPDEGLVRSRKDAILKTMGVSKDDPFAYNAYDSPQIADEPSLLHEGLSATTLMGDAPVIAIAQATDKITAHVKSALESITQPNPLIITAGDLQKRSSLRSFFEDAKARDVASIPCYRDEGASLAQLVRSFLQARKIEASPQLITLLSEQLGNDRAVTVSELEKLDLYLGERRRLSEDDIEKILANNQHRESSDALLDGLCGNQANFYEKYDALIAAGEQPIALLRLLGRIMQQLLDAKAMQQQDQLSPASAVERLRPFVYFKDKPRYINILSRMDMPHLLSLMCNVQDAELQIKRGALHHELIISQMLMLRRTLPN